MGTNQFFVLVRVHVQADGDCRIPDLLVEFAYLFLLFGAGRAPDGKTLQKNRLTFEIGDPEGFTA
jgi:hypothetical protein